jgi:hypothetical protein
MAPGIELEYFMQIIPLKNFLQIVKSVFDALGQGPRKPCTTLQRLDKKFSNFRSETKLIEYSHPELAE